MVVFKVCCCFVVIEIDIFVDGEWIKFVLFEKGKKIYNEIVKRNLEDDVFVGNSFVIMYVSCGSLRVV